MTRPRPHWSSDCRPRFVGTTQQLDYRDPHRGRCGLSLLMPPRFFPARFGGRLAPLRNIPRAPAQLVAAASPIQTMPGRARHREAAAPSKLSRQHQRFGSLKGSESGCGGVSTRRYAVVATAGCRFRERGYALRRVKKAPDRAANTECRTLSPELRKRRVPTMHDRSARQRPELNAGPGAGRQAGR